MVRQSHDDHPADADHRPDDPFRFTYRLYRIAKGGEVLAPGDGQDHVQIIDWRDLAEWAIRMVENGTTGTFNAAGPASVLTMAEQLNGVRRAVPADREAKFTWVPAAFLESHDVTAWGDMPTWIPLSDPDATSMNADNRRAIAAGLTLRPQGTSAVDALAWFNAQTAEAQARIVRAAGPSPEREKEVLDPFGR